MSRIAINVLEVEKKSTKLRTVFFKDRQTGKPIVKLRRIE